MIELQGHQVETDKEGYLQNLDEWSSELAELIAQQEGICLSPAHWEILYLLRQFYNTFQVSPAMRPLVKYTQQQLGPEKGKSVYLLSLFPGSPPKLAAKIAGLPRPTNCL